ncbi:MAG TPA: DUF3667 domain-containing protein [Phenylobacterium sp.]
MTSELETAAADTVAELSRRRRGPTPAPGSACANCGTVLQGRYCHVCSQDSDAHKRSILRLMVESAQGLFDLDGRILRTVPALFLGPGKLARDYMEGRIVRHVPPFRTFLVALLLFILAAEHATHRLAEANAARQRAEASALTTPAGRAAAAASLRTEAAKDLAEDLKDAAADRADDLKDPDQNRAKAEAAYTRVTDKAKARYAAQLQKADRIAQGLPAAAPASVQPPGAPVKKRSWLSTAIHKATANPESYLAVLFAWGQRTAVLLLPIVGLTLALVYRNRPEIFIYDHLLVAMNLLSFAFLANAFGLILPPVLMAVWFAILAVWTPVNLFQTLRGGYGSSVPGAIAKTLIVWITTVVAFSLLVVALMVFSLSQL